MRLYVSSGHSYLVCPDLIALDARHGEHWSKHPNCRLGRDCIRKHKHERALPEGGGHVVNDFYWLPGCRPPSPAEHPVCSCGKSLVWADLDDPYGAEHLTGEAGEGGA
jgi:hypothetical protein